MLTAADLSSRAGEAARAAIQNYALAAAYEEVLDDGASSEHQMYFVVRALCNEHGLRSAAIIESARRNVRAAYTG